MFKKWILKYIAKQLLTTTFRTKLICYVNSKVDIPKLTEPQEAVLFDAVYTAITEYLS